MKINEVFKTLIPELEKNEFELLESSILEHGIQSPLIVWEDTLVDGHNRYEIAMRYNLAYPVEKIEFNNEDEACEWIIKNQLGRRNLAPEAIKFFIGQLYNFKKKTVGGIVGHENYYLPKDEVENFSTPTPPEKTSEAIANQYNVTERSVRNYAKAAESINQSPTIKAAVVDGTLKLNEAVELAEVIKDLKGIDEKIILSRAKEIFKEKKLEKKAQLSDYAKESPIPDREQKIINALQEGETMVFNMKEDKHVYDWALKNGKFEAIDRNTVWGNPFILDADGDRETVCENYEFKYLPYKPSLIKKVKNLKGKALGCWCSPLKCHGDTLKKLSDE